jgi:hypothetical protein
MKNPLKYFILIITLLSIVLTIECCIRRIDWVGNEGSGTIVKGLVKEPDGKTPACGAYVELTRHKSGLDPYALPKRSSRDSSFFRSKRTDKNGAFEFDSIPDDFYLLSARDTGNYWMRDSIVIKSDSDYTPSTYTLQSPAGIQLILPRFDDSTKASIRIVGLEIKKEIDTGGTFILMQLPAGSFNIQLKIFKGDDTSYYCDSFTVIAGEITVIKFEQLTAFYRVIYNGNGNTSGVAPVDKRLYKKGEEVILKDSGDLAKEGAGFHGWNTKAEGRGAFYKAGAVITMDTVNVTLYAKWDGDEYLLTLTTSGNGKISGPDSVMLPSKTPYSITAIPDSGYHLSGWRVMNGNAVISDSIAETTQVILENGNATIQGRFKAGYTFKKEYGDSSDEKAYSIQPTIDGGFIIVGSYVPFHSTQGSSGIFIMNTDASGNVLWKKILGNGYQANSIQSTIDGNFVIIGNTMLSAGESDICLIKIDKNGNQIWIRTFGGPYSDAGNSVQQTNDGGFIITGNSHDSICLIKTDANGTLRGIKLSEYQSTQAAEVPFNKPQTGVIF